VALTELYTKILEELLVKLSYYADCAGLHYSVQHSFTGIDLAFYGYHHKLPVLVSRVVETMKELSSGSAGGVEDIYQRMKEKVILGFKNFKFNQPYMHCIVGTLNCVESPRWHVTEKLAALEASSFLEFQAFSFSLLRALHTEMFIHGNATVGI
jgi:secreted Zn-dependent insulinase-like peptidase